MIDERFSFLRSPQIAHTAAEALDLLKNLYQKNTETIHRAMEKNRDSTEPQESLEATYPFLGCVVSQDQVSTDAQYAYGAIAEAGLYGTTITRPDLFEDYLKEQIQMLIDNHGISMVVGESDQKIPLPFALPRDTNPVNISIGEPEQWKRQNWYTLPDLSTIDDTIANCTPYETNIRPLSLFNAPRTDISLHRLEHYTGTNVEHFQRFILLTNYQRYMDAFLEFGKDSILNEGEYEDLIGPGNHSFRDGAFGSSLSQMPAYHLTRPDKNGITFINIGVGPSNAKTITDHLAVLRPHCWLMLGHCAGLRRSQQLGDYVLAHAYVRADSVLDDDLPPWVPIPSIAEVQQAIQQAIQKITKNPNLKSHVRTGTVFTTGNRNWEFRSRELRLQFEQSRSIAVDMESATLSANGFRFRVPYGTLLCVSDKPLHGELKLPKMANSFYQQRVQQHLMIGIETMSLLRTHGVEVSHSRKLRGFNDPPFR